MAHNQSLPPGDREEAVDGILPERTRPAAVDARRKFTPGDVINEATKALPENQRSAIRRFHAYQVKHGMTLDEVGKFIGRDGSTMSSVFKGKYPAALDRIVADMEEFLSLMERRESGRKTRFIETKLSKRIWALCDAAQARQRIGMIWNDSQIGKTRALKEYTAAHNHGKTIYASIPSSGSPTEFCFVLADILNIPTTISMARLRRRIIAAFDDRMLLIVDEVSNCLPPGDTKSKRIQCVEFIREIFNTSECGVVLCGTRLFKDAMEKGFLAGLLNQTKRRRLLAMDIDDVPTKEDLNTFAAAHGLEPARGAALVMENDITHAEGLGRWLTILESGSQLAKQDGKPMSWGYVISARDAFRAMEGN